MKCNEKHHLGYLCELEAGHTGSHQVGGGGDDDRSLTWPVVATIAQCIDDACREVIGPKFTSAIRSPGQKLRTLMEYCFMRRLNYGALNDLVREGYNALEQQRFLTTPYQKPSHGWLARPRLEREGTHHRIILDTHTSQWCSTGFNKLIVDGRTYVAAPYHSETFPEEEIFIVEKLSP